MERSYRRYVVRVLTKRVYVDSMAKDYLAKAYELCIDARKGDGRYFWHCD